MSSTFVEKEYLGGMHERIHVHDQAVAPQNYQERQSSKLKPYPSNRQAQQYDLHNVSRHDDSLPMGPVSGQDGRSAQMSNEGTPGGKSAAQQIMDRINAKQKNIEQLRKQSNQFVMGLKSGGYGKHENGSLSGSQQDKTPKNAGAIDLKASNAYSAKPPKSIRKNPSRPQGRVTNQKKVGYQSDTNEANPPIRGGKFAQKQATQVEKEKPAFIQMHQWQEWNSTHDEVEAQFNNEEILKPSPIKQDNESPPPRRGMNRFSNQGAFNDSYLAGKNIAKGKNERGGPYQRTSHLPSVVDSKQTTNQKSKHRSQPKYQPQSSKYKDQVSRSGQDGGMFQGGQFINKYQDRMIKSPEDGGPLVDTRIQNGDVSNIQTNQDEHMQSNDDIGALVKDLMIQPKTHARMNEDQSSLYVDNQKRGFKQMQKKKGSGAGTGGPAGFSTQASLYGNEKENNRNSRKPHSLDPTEKMRFNKQNSNHMNNVQRKRGKLDAYSVQGTTQTNNLTSGLPDPNLKVSNENFGSKYRKQAMEMQNRSEITNALHMKNKTMSNISIIDRISERQNRMEEKYFNQDIKQKRKSTTNEQNQQHYHPKFQRQVDQFDGKNMYGVGRQDQVNRNYADGPMQENIAVQSRGYNAKSLPRNPRALNNKNRSQAAEFRDASHQDDHRNQRSSFYANDNPYKNKNLRSQRDKHGANGAMTGAQFSSQDNAVTGQNNSNSSKQQKKPNSLARNNVPPPGANKKNNQGNRQPSYSVASQQNINGNGQFGGTQGLGVSGYSASVNPTRNFGSKKVSSPRPIPHHNQNNVTQKNRRHGTQKNNNVNAYQNYPEEEKDKVNQLEWQNSSNMRGPKWGTGVLSGHGKSTGYQHNQGVTQNSDKNSQHNFSTTTKSKFNTIDQYNQVGQQGNMNNNGSNSRQNSPVRMTNQFNQHQVPISNDKNETHGGFNIRNCTIYTNKKIGNETHQRQNEEAGHDDEDEIEESIREEIQESRGQERKKKPEDTDEAKRGDLEQSQVNPFNRSNMKTNNATPNTLLSNKQKLNRGISRDSQNNFNNGTLLNFGLAGQSTRSTFMKTPLMFGQNAHAKLRDINSNQNLIGIATQNSQHSKQSNQNNIFSPQSGFRRNFGQNGQPNGGNGGNYQRMDTANRAVLKDHYNQQLNQQFIGLSPISNVMNQGNRGGGNFQYTAGKQVYQQYPANHDNSMIRNLQNEISRDLQDQEDGRYTQSLLGQMNLQSPSSNTDPAHYQDGKPQFLYVTAQKTHTQVESLQQIIEGSANEQNNSSSQTDKLQEMSAVGNQYNNGGMQGVSEQNSMIAPSKFVPEDVSRSQLHGDYGKEHDQIVDASNFEDTLQRSMLIGDLQMDTSKDVLRVAGRGGVQPTRHDMSAFVDQDVSQSTSKLDMSMYGLDSMMMQADDHRPPIYPSMKRPYSPPLKHLTSQQEQD